MIKTGRIEVSVDQAADRLIVPLDFGSASEARQWVDLLSPLGCRFKIGLELWTACGPEILQDVDPGRTFLDLKFHDIPNTVACAARSAARLGVWMFNVHASGGLEMMHVAAEAAREAFNPAPLAIAVTVLTSTSRSVMNREMGVSGAVEAQVEHLARLALEAGMDGVVCSPLEVTIVREACGGKFVTVTPGVRPEASAPSDHHRVTTVGEAVRLGADYLVIGRPITTAKDPVAMANQIIRDIG